jgi:ATP-dependent DNA helicase RecG
MGVVEQLARNRLVLSRRFYSFVGRPGEYTRRRGLDRQTNKELLLRHVARSGQDGAPMDELLQVLPAKTRDQIKHLLFELRREGRVNRIGVTRAARWVAVRPSDADAPSLREAVVAGHLAWARQRRG